jgi:hypothetical protein
MGLLIDAPFDAHQDCVLMSRLVASLIAFLLAVMPLTEYLWTWDHFLHGGQDLEFGMLGIVAVLGIACILSLHTAKWMTLLVMAQRFISLILQRVLGLFACSASELLTRGYPSKKIPDPGLDLYSLPLQI